MLKTRAAVLVLEFGSAWEIAAISGPAHRWDRAIQLRLAAALIEHANLPFAEFGAADSAEEVLGEELAHALVWHQISLIPLRGSEGALLGVLCLVDPEHAHSKIERQLLESLAGHASVALENVRLFSRIEQSRKQWVEDFDAISDLIVVHGADGRILRLNRALADNLKVKPTEAIGRDMGKLELLGSSIQAGRCPFCRNPKAAQEEFIFQEAERSYLVSASRIHSGHDD